MSYLIGVDLGTQGTKACIRDETGSVAGEAFAPSKLYYSGAGAVTENPEEMLSSVLFSIREAVEKSGIDPGKVVALCIDGQMAGIMGVDADGLAVTPYDSWLDTRCDAYRQHFIDYGEDLLIKLTGAPVTYAHGPKILWWRENHPETYRRICKFVQPGVYCTMRMCGLAGCDAYIDHTYLHFSGFANNQRRCWSEDLLTDMGIDRDKMPRILRPFDIVGRLCSEMAALCGLVDGIPLVAGCGDTAASIFGAGVIRSGLMFDVAGTASVLACATTEYVPDVAHKTLLYASSVMDGLYTPMAYINGGGMCLKWLRDDILNGAKTYGELDLMAKDVPPGSNDLLFLPHFSGRVCPNDTLVRGSYMNLSWKHTSAHLHRAIMEGIAYEYGVYSDIMKELVPSLKHERVISVGGGSKSLLFGQIKADVLGVPISTIHLADTASLACCAIAGYGIGLYENMTSLVKKVYELKSTIEPDAKCHNFYKYRKKAYIHAIDALHDVYGNLLGLEAWDG